MLQNKCFTGLALFIFQATCAAQIITTVAGTNWFFPPITQPALSAPLGGLSATVEDSSGNLYIADPDNNIVVMVAPGGVLSIVAGNGVAGYSGDGGPAAGASLNSPSGLALDAAGNLYIADYGNYRVRVVNAGGVISTFAGTGSSISFGEGVPATSAGVTPFGLALDVSGNLYIADTYVCRVRKVNSSGNISSVAGSGFPGYNGDGGQATNAGMCALGVAVDPGGNMFLADYPNQRIRKVDGGTGIITTIAGNGHQGFSGDGGRATAAQLNSPQSIVVDSSGDVFFTDTGNNRVREVSASGTITTVAGNGSAGFSGDGGPAVMAAMLPDGVCVDGSGNLFIADAGNQRLREVTPDGNIQTLAGNGTYQFAGDGNFAPSAVLSSPESVAVDGAGNLYIADSGNRRIRMVGTDGTIQTIAGNGAIGYSGDGPATSVGFDPAAVAVDANGNVYIADQFNNRIRQAAPGGMLTTLAGTGVAGYSGDNGPAVSAMLNGPSGLALDGSGNLYVADQQNNRIRMIAPDGTITTVAGNGNARFAGDHGPAAGASLYLPSGVALDAAGNLYIADQNNGRIREVAAGTGVITTIAGFGTAGFSGDGGPALQAQLNFPYSVALDGSGNLYIADAQNNRIRMVTPDGTMQTVAGISRAALSGDGGPPAAAALDMPSAVAFDGNGNIYIADFGNNRIREIIAASAASFSPSPNNLSFSAIAGAPPSPSQTFNLSTSVPGAAFTASPSDPWLIVTPTSGAMPASLQVSVDASSLSAGTYQGTITITAPDLGSSSTVAVTLVVQPAIPPSLNTSPQSLTFTASSGSSPQNQQVQVQIAGITTSDFSVSSTTSSGGSWLSVSPAGGTATPTAPGIVTITATPGSLASGIYQGSASIAGSIGNATVPVTLAIPPGAQLQLSQTGLSFTAIAMGNAPLAQNLAILNIGQGAMSWSAWAATQSGGNWLQISTTTGVVAQGNTDGSQLTVSVNPAGLSTGAYSGTIQISANGSGSPQSVPVTLTIVDAATNTGPQVYPAGLIFTGIAGNTPGSQDSMLLNPEPAPNTFSTSQTGSGFTYLPGDATLPPNQSPAQPQILRVFPDFSKLGSNAVAPGKVNLQFTDGTQRSVRVMLIAAPKGCTTNNLEVVFRSPSADQSFTAVAGKSFMVEVVVADDCGNLVGPGNTGSAQVNVSFSNNDPDISLTHVGAGVWTGTWTPNNVVTGQLTLTASAFNFLPHTLQGGNFAASGVLSAH